MGWRGRVSGSIALVFLMGFVCGIAGASDPPDSALNHASGFIETVDSVQEGSSHNIRHVIDRGSGQPPLTTMVTDDGLDDLSPRIVVGSGGDAWIVWWRDGTTDEVFVRKLTRSPRTWGAAERISLAGESSRNPEIAEDGTAPWVAYELDAAGGTGIDVLRIDETPDPFPTLLATTPYTGDLDTMIHAESGHLWVTWVDSDADVGWSEYDYGAGTWSTPELESYESDDVSAARGRISHGVVGN